MLRWVPVIMSMFACGRVNFDPTGGSAIDADTSPRIIDVAVGNQHTCALANTGQLKCWGWNMWGVLGIGDPDPGAHERPADLPAVSLGTISPVENLTVLVDYTCARLANGTVKCWGNNDGAQLGTGDYRHRGDDPDEMGDTLQPVALSAGPPIDQIVAGHYHTCILRGGNVACWGNNDNDQNGYPGARTTPMDLATLGNVNLGTGFVPVDLHTMFNSTCARDVAGRMKCWGANYSADLGLGDLQNRGDSAADMGDNLPFVDAGGPILQVATGHHHTCALTATGLHCWGAGVDGALGSGNENDRGDQPNEMGANLPIVDLGGPVESVSCGANFSCAILTGGIVKCWGVNGDGQLGVGDTRSRGDDPGEMGSALPSVPLPAPATRVFAGGEAACAILETGELACWGSNAEGQLGTSGGDLGDQPGEMPVVHSVAELFP